MTNVIKNNIMPIKREILPSLINLGFLTKIATIKIKAKPTLAVTEPSSATDKKQTDKRGMILLILPFLLKRAIKLIKIAGTNIAPN